MRQEFKQHLDCDPKYLSKFLEEWVSYYQTMSSAQNFSQFAQSAPQPIDEDFLSEEQKRFLGGLRTAIEHGRDLGTKN